MAMMQPQTSVMGANANTSVPQTQAAAQNINPYTAATANPPPQLNPFKTGNQTQALQKSGMPTSQAVTKSAQNPNNRYAEGGIVHGGAVSKPWAHHVSLPPHNLIRKAMGGPIAPTGSGTISIPNLANPPNKLASPIGTPSQTGSAIHGNRANRGPMHAATNKRFAQGGTVPPPPNPSQIEQEKQPSSKAVAAISKAISDEEALKQPNKPDETEAMLSQYTTKSGSNYLKDRANMTTPKATGQDDSRFAKGGDVHNKIKDMPLKDVIKLLASHPEVGGMGGGNVNTPLQGNNMAAGGNVMGQGEPDATPKKKIANMKSEARSHGAGLLNMNADVQTYAQGGNVNAPPIPTAPPQIAAGTLPPQQQQQASGAVPSVAMAGGGGLEGDTESDNIVGYGPDGTPIIQNADGTEQYGDINQLLDRPESAPTVGTGQTPTSGVSSNAANSVAGANEAVATAPSNQMAKGGEEAGPPPGALSEEVADDVPAQLSEGEFVMNAQTARYWGLKTLNTMQELAQQALGEMQNAGQIRSPGDGKNPGDNTGFQQDQKPNPGFFNDEQGPAGSSGPDSAGSKSGMSDDDVTGILKECMGGDNYNEGGAVPQLGMAMGGGVAEENSLKKGGQPTPQGTDNMVSSHPKGGGTLVDYAKGGIVTPKSINLSPKSIGKPIPTDTAKLSKPVGLEVPKIHSKPIGLPKMAKGGGMTVKNMMPMTMPHQSYIGS